jgi:hypothetical protein
MLALLISTLSGCGQAVVESQAPRANRPPVIDGLTDEVWQRVKADSLRNVAMGGTDIKGSGDIAGTYKVLWDQHNMYLFIEVTDDVKFSLNPKKFGMEGIWDPWQNDVVEIFLDTKNRKSKSFEPTAGDFRYAFVYQADSVSSPAQSPLRGIKHAQSDSPEGYKVEVQVPWSTLNFSPTDGSVIGFEVNLIDNDTDTTKLGAGIFRDRETVLTWSEKEGVNSWQWTSVYGNLKFSSDPLAGQHP